MPAGWCFHSITNAQTEELAKLSKGKRACSVRFAYLLALTASCDCPAFVRFVAHCVRPMPQYHTRRARELAMVLSIAQSLHSCVRIAFRLGLSLDDVCKTIKAHCRPAKRLPEDLYSQAEENLKDLSRLDWLPLGAE